jgi:hypothetical protein
MLDRKAKMNIKKYKSLYMHWKIMWKTSLSLKFACLSIVSLKHQMLHWKMMHQAIYILKIMCLRR